MAHHEPNLNCAKTRTGSAAGIARRPPGQLLSYFLLCRYSILRQIQIIQIQYKDVTGWSFAKSTVPMMQAVHSQLQYVSQFLHTMWLNQNRTCSFPCQIQKSEIWHSVKEPLLKPPRIQLATLENSIEHLEGAYVTSNRVFIIICIQSFFFLGGAPIVLRHDLRLQAPNSFRFRLCLTARCPLVSAPTIGTSHQMSPLSR